MFYDFRWWKPKRKASFMKTSTWVLRPNIWSNNVCYRNSNPSTAIASDVPSEHCFDNPRWFVIFWFPTKGLILTRRLSSILNSNLSRRTLSSWNKNCVKTKNCIHKHLGVWKTFPKKCMKNVLKCWRNPWNVNQASVQSWLVSHRPSATELNWTAALFLRISQFRKQATTRRIAAQSSVISLKVHNLFLNISLHSRVKYSLVQSRSKLVVACRCLLIASNGCGCCVGFGCATRSCCTSILLNNSTMWKRWKDPGKSSDEWCFLFLCWILKNFLNIRNDDLNSWNAKVNINHVSFNKLQTNLHSTFT